MAEGIVMAPGYTKGLVNRPTVLSTQAFVDFSCLRLLHLYGFAFKGEFLCLPERLKWLRLSNCEFSISVLQLILKWLSGVSNLHAISILEIVLVDDVNQILMEITSSSRKAFDALKILHLEYSLMTRTPDFSNMKCLRKLMLRNCKMLTEVDGSIGSLKNLVHLDMCYCHALQQLPDGICTLMSLETLILEGCKSLSSLPEKLGNMKSLRWLWVEDTSIREIPDSISDLSNLHTLSLIENPHLEKLHDSLWRLDSLEELNIYPFPRYHFADRNLNLINLEPALCIKYAEGFEWLAVLPNSACEKVKELTIGDDSIQELPPYLGRLTNLEALSISCRNLRSLPEWLGQLRKLKSFELESDGLESLPEWLGQLQELRSFKLHCDNLRALPEWLGQLQKLKSFELEFDSLEALPEWLGQLQALPEWLGQLQKLRSFKLHCDNLRALPEWLGQLQELRSFKLHCDNLRALPEWLGQLQKLKSFELESDSLEALPECLGQLQKLKSFKLHCKNFRTLPEWLGQLQKLKSFELEFDGLEALPECLGQLQKLKSFKLHCKNLRALPECLGQLQKLKSFELECDSLEALPATARKTFENLRSLKLHCPTLKHVPDWIASVERLEKLSLCCCRSITFLPTSMFANGCSVRTLNLSHTNISALPSSMSNLAQLENLHLNRCENLQSLPPLPSSLHFLYARHCDNLRTISDVSNLKSLRKLSLGGCRLLGDFCGLESIAHNLEMLELPGPFVGLSRFSQLSPAFMTRVFKRAAFSSLETFFVGRLGRRQDGEARSDHHQSFSITFPKVGRGGKRPPLVNCSFLPSWLLEKQELSISISIEEEDGHAVYECTAGNLYHCISGEEIVDYSREGSYLRMRVSAFTSNLNEIRLDDAFNFEFITHGRLLGHRPSRSTRRLPQRLFFLRRSRLLLQSIHLLGSMVSRIIIDVDAFPEMAFSTGSMNSANLPYSSVIELPKSSDYDVDDDYEEAYLIIPNLDTLQFDQGKGLDKGTEQEMKSLY
ncbi:popC protein [Nymphaea thermarum]|nr:popC protein [Nymphaea thermarum]